MLPRRVLPPGVLTGLAAAVKLTPAIFVIYLIAVRRWRAALAAVATGIAVTVLSLVAVPGPSIGFWTRLAAGDTGLGQSVIYYTNQSVMADVVRVLTGSSAGDDRARLVGSGRLGGCLGSDALAPPRGRRLCRDAVRNRWTTGLAGLVVAPLRLGCSLGLMPHWR